MDDSMADWLAYARALLLARAPRDWEIVTSAPTLLINDKALHIHVKNPATPTAATLSLPDHVGHVVCHLNERGRDKGNRHAPDSLADAPLCQVVCLCHFLVLLRLAKI